MEEKPNPYQAPDAQAERPPAPLWRRILAIVVFVAAIIPGTYFAIFLWFIFFETKRPPADVQQWLPFYTLVSGAATFMVIWFAYRIRR
jgi:hypothetical protein